MSTPTPAGLWPISDDVADGPRPRSVLSIKDMREMTTIRPAPISRASKIPNPPAEKSQGSRRPSSAALNSTSGDISWAKRPPLATQLLLRQEAFASPRARKLITSASTPPNQIRPKRVEIAKASMPITSATRNAPAGPSREPRETSIIAKTPGFSSTEVNVPRSFHSLPSNPHEITYLHDDSYDGDKQSEAKRTQMQLDSFEFFRSLRLTRTILPVDASGKGKTREQCLKEAVKEIKRERVIKQNGPNKLHLNLGPEGTSDHIYIRYAFPYEPFQTPLIKWLRHLVRMQRHPVVEELRKRYLSSTLPLLPTFTRNEMVNDLPLPSKYITVLNIIDGDGTGGSGSGPSSRNSLRNREWLERFASKYGTKPIGGPPNSVSRSNSVSVLSFMAPNVPPSAPAHADAIVKWASLAHYERSPRAGPPKTFEEESARKALEEEEELKRQKKGPSRPVEVGSDPFIYSLKKVWVRHSDYDKFQGMPYSADNFKRFLTDAIYGGVKTPAKAATGESKTTTEAVSQDLTTTFQQISADDPRFLTTMSSSSVPYLTALPPPPPWSLETPLLDPQLCEELFHACNDMSSQRLAYPMAFLYLHLFLLRAVPSVQVDLLRVLMCMSRKRMAMRPLEITAQDFYTVVLLLEQFLENFSTVPAANAHPESSAYRGHRMKGNMETGIDTSVIHSKTTKLRENWSASPRGAEASSSGMNAVEETVLPTSNVPCPEAAALLAQYRREIQYFSDNIPKDNYALHFNEVFSYFPPNSVLVKHMHCGADDDLKAALADEASMLGTLPKHKEAFPSVSELMSQVHGNHRRGIPRLEAQEALLAVISETRRSKPRPGTQSVEKSGATSYIDRPPCLV